MSHTYATNIVHCVFSTKERVLSIPENRQQELWAYLPGIARNMEIKILAVGGVRDHLHLLISLPPKMNLAKVMCDLKANSSKWLNESGVDFAWQQGYGAFSVSVFPALTRWANEWRRFRGFRARHAFWLPPSAWRWPWRSSGFFQFAAEPDQ